MKTDATDRDSPLEAKYLSLWAREELFPYGKICCLFEHCNSSPASLFLCSVEPFVAIYFWFTLMGNYNKWRACHRGMSTRNQVSGNFLPSSRHSGLCEYNRTLVQSQQEQSGLLHPKAWASCVWEPTGVVH